MTDRVNLSRIQNEVFDVVVLGGGINGAAGAQQLAARGFKVLLVDKGDFGSGSSSRSSRLLHCGLRYLAPGSSPWEFVAHPSRFFTGLNMAQLAIQARDEFIKSTANRTQIAKLYFPIYEGGSYAGWQVDAAFAILGTLNHGKTPLNYKRVKGKAALSLPLISGLRDIDRLESVACYDEYQIAWPERVTLDIAMDAASMGAMTRNYTMAKIRGRRTAGYEISLEDVLTKEAVTVSAKSVVNTTGIWIDEVFKDQRAGKDPKILGTKGSHIVVRLSDECRGTGVATMNRKNEPFYCLPWGENHYIGPTEVVYKDNLDAIGTSEEERDWLLDEANHLFPQLRLTSKDVLFTWSGVRPLTWDAQLPRGNRKRVLHDLDRDGLPGVFAMTGGPLMTHRSAGLEIAEKVSSHLSGLASPSAARSPTYSSSFPQLEPSDVLSALKGASSPNWLKKVLRDEQVVHLSDVILRRTGVAWHEKISNEDVRKIATNLGELIGWTKDRIESEISHFSRELDILQGTAERSK